MFKTYTRQALLAHTYQPNKVIDKSFTNLVCTRFEKVTQKPLTYRKWFCVVLRITLLILKYKALCTRTIRRGILYSFVNPREDKHIFSKTLFCNSSCMLASSYCLMKGCVQAFCYTEVFYNFTMTTDYHEIVFLSIMADSFYCGYDNFT